MFNIKELFKLVLAKDTAAGGVFRSLSVDCFTVTVLGMNFLAYTSIIYPK